MTQESTASGILIANNIVSDNNDFAIKVDPAVVSAVTVTRNLIDKLPGQAMKENETLGSNSVTGGSFRVQESEPNYWSRRPHSPNGDDHFSDDGFSDPFLYMGDDGSFGGR